MFANRFNPGCKCCTRTPPCPTGTGCVTFEPACDQPPTGVSITLDFTPTDPGGTTATITGSSLHLCIVHVGAGTVSWTFSADNYLPQSGSFAVTECGNGGGPVIDIYANTYQFCILGCNIVTDGTAVTVTLSGSASGSCTPTVSTIPAGRPFAGSPALCCTLPVTSPVTTPPTIDVTADRYQIDHGSATIIGTCWATVSMKAADGYFCCNVTNDRTCKPISCTLTLSTPLGDFHIDQCAVGVTPFITATVLGRANVTTGYIVECGCDSVGPLSNVSVTFYLTQFSCTSSGWNGTIGYQACPLNPASIDCGPGQGNDWVAAEDGFNSCFRGGSGAYTFNLSGSCPPGTVGTFRHEGCHNRYLSGAYTLVEA